MAFPFFLFGAGTHQAGYYGTKSMLNLWKKPVFCRVADKSARLRQLAAWAW